MAEKKIVSLAKIRNKITLKKVFRIIRIPVVVLAVVAALFLSARLLGNVAVSNITDGIREIKTVFSRGEGYPYQLDTFNYRKSFAIGNRPLILHNDSSKVLSSSAGDLFYLPLDYADSKVISKKSRALIYSNSANKIVIQSKTEKLGEFTEEGTVVAAALAKNGSFATSYSNEDYQSVLSVYNSRFKKIFQWNCSQERIADISLSGNGKKVALIAVGTENAEIYTRLLVFDTGSSKPLADVRFDGTLFLRVAYTTSGRVIAAGDNRTVVLNKKGELLDELVYSEDSLCAICVDGNGNTVVGFKEFGGSKTGIVRFSASGRKTCTFSVDGVPDCIVADGGRIAVATGTEIAVYSSGGKQTKDIQTDNPVSEMFICSGTVYSVQGTSVVKH